MQARASRDHVGHRRRTAAFRISAAKSRSSPVCVIAGTSELTLVIEMIEVHGTSGGRLAIRWSSAVIQLSFS